LEVWKFGSLGVMPELVIDILEQIRDAWLLWKKDVPLPKVLMTSVIVKRGRKNLIAKD